MKRTAFILFILLVNLFSISAQELNCKVSVNAENVPTLNKRIVSALESEINQFVNNKRWTDLQFQQNEKIDCSMVIVLREVENERNFKADFQVQSRRPVYNSNYFSPIFVFKDLNFEFEYLEMTALEYTDGMFTSNLTSFLAYYCYIIIGYDCDSFAKMSGTPYFTKAENIVNMAQGRAEKGWKAFEDNRNRYALVNSLLDPSLRPFREFFYEYHRLGLDEMSVNPTNAAAKIAASMQVLREVNRARPSNVVVTSFLETKRDELLNVFSKASNKDKTEVYKILVEIDPAQQARYDQILK